MDGHDVRSWISTVYVPAWESSFKSFLFAATVRKISPSAAREPIEEIERAARLAAADEFIRTCPKVTIRNCVRGNQLIRGQRQRLLWPARCSTILAFFCLMIRRQRSIRIRSGKFSAPRPGRCGTNCAAGNPSDRRASPSRLGDRTGGREHRSTGRAAGACLDARILPHTGGNAMRGQ